MGHYLNHATLFANKLYTFFLTVCLGRFRQEHNIKHKFHLANLCVILL